jgi:hypothetical protein
MVPRRLPTFVSPSISLSIIVYSTVRLRFPVDNLLK